MNLKTRLKQAKTETGIKKKPLNTLFRIYRMEKMRADELFIKLFFDVSFFTNHLPLIFKDTSCTGRRGLQNSPSQTFVVW